MSMSKPIQTVEELDAVLHWRGKHAIAVRERDGLQVSLNTADQTIDDLNAAVSRRTKRVRELEAQLAYAVDALNEVVKASAMYEKPFEIATLAIGEMSALKTADGGDEHDATKDLACYFGLTYASWLTLPRVLMEAMPEEWKRSMATLLNQYDDAYPNQPSYGTTVRVTVDGKMVRTPEWLVNYRHPDRSMINRVRGLSG
nr:MAG TPA: SlyX-like protein [Bacteriophage sp.]